MSELLEAPARDVKIAFSSEDLRRPFPSLHEIEKSQCRGEILHFFANHELLALELMAWVLLKFPDAPKAFRRGLAETMKEEQEHMGFYLTRMQSFGVELATCPFRIFFGKH